MPILKNQRDELFCQGIAAGKSATDAYGGAGYSGVGLAESASRLLRNVRIRDRIAELQAEIAKKGVELSAALGITR